MTAPEAAPARDASARVVHAIIALGLIVFLVLVGVRGIPVLDASLRPDLLSRHGLGVIGVPLAIVIAASKRKGPRPLSSAGWQSSSRSSLLSARSGDAG
jgi:hypothetical protein